MAGTDTRQKTPVSKFGAWVGYMVVFAISTTFFMLFGEYILERFDITNPGWWWYACVSAIVANVVFMAREAFIFAERMDK